MQRQVENELLSEGSIDIEQDAEGNVRFYVEKVLDSRYNETEKCQEYKLKWKGYPIEQSTWELETTIDASNVKKMAAEFDRLLASSNEAKQIAEERKRNHWHQVRYLVPQFHYDSKNKSSLIDPVGEHKPARTASSSHRPRRNMSKSPRVRTKIPIFPTNPRNTSNTRDKKMLNIIKAPKAQPLQEESKNQDSIKIATKSASNAKSKVRNLIETKAFDLQSSSMQDSSGLVIQGTRRPARKTVTQVKKLEEVIEKKEEDHEKIDPGKRDKSPVQARKRASDSPILNPRARRNQTRSPTTKRENESPTRGAAKVQPPQTAPTGMMALRTLPRRDQKSKIEVSPKRTTSLRAQGPPIPSPMRKSKIFEEEKELPRFEESESSVFLPKLKKQEEVLAEKRSTRKDSRRAESKKSKKSSRSPSRKSKRSESRKSRQSSKSRELYKNIKHKLPLKKGEYYGMIVRDDAKRILSHYNQGEEMNFLVEWRKDHKGRRPVPSYVTEGELVENCPDLLVDYLGSTQEEKIRRSRSASKRSRSSRSKSKRRSKSRKSSNKKRRSRRSSRTSSRGRRTSRRRSSSRQKSRGSHRSRSSKRSRSRSNRRDQVELRGSKRSFGKFRKSESVQQGASLRKRSRSRSKSSGRRLSHRNRSRSGSRRDSRRRRSSSRRGRDAAAPKKLADSRRLRREGSRSSRRNSRGGPRSRSHSKAR